MPRPKGVVGGFLHPGKAGDAVAASQGVKLRVAPGQELVGIALVADVEDYFVLGGVVDCVKRDGQLHRSQIGSEVPAVFGYHREYSLPHLGG